MSRPRDIAPPWLGRSGLLIWLLVSACGGGTDRGNLPLVATSPARPLLQDSTLHDVRRVWYPSADRIAVLTSYEPLLRRYSLGGVPEAQFGRKGGGPGEFRLAWAPVEYASGLEVWDPARARIVSLSATGVETGATPVRGLVPNTRIDIGDVTFGDPFQVAAHPAGFVLQSFPAPISAADDLLNGSLVVLSRAGVVTDTLFNFRTVVGRDRLVGPARRLIPVPLWAGCPSGTLIIYDGVTPELRILEDGDRQRAAVRALPAHLHLGESLADSEVRNYVRHTLIYEFLEHQADTLEVDAEVDRLLAEGRSGFGRIVPTVTRLLCDEAGAIWLNEFSTSDDPVGYSRFWTVMAAEGTYRVEMPARFRVHQVRAGGAIGTTVDPYGVVEVATVRLLR
jgi:hypothetical protein